MPVKFDNNTKMFHLYTPNTSYIFKIRGDYAIEHLYYGKKLDNTKGMEITNYNSANCSLMDCEKGYDGRVVWGDLFTHEYSFYGSCDLRKPSFHAVYEDGSRISKMKYFSHEIYSGKPKLEGLPATYVENEKEAQTLELNLYDENTGLSITLVYTAYTDIDAITRSVKVKNNGNQNINIKSVLSMNLDFNDDDFDFIHLWGAWARERSIQRSPLIKGTNKIESRRDSSSHQHSPFFAMARKNTTENEGEIYGFSLVYSGNFEAGVEVDTYGQARAFMGINSFDFNWLLEPDEEFVAPEVVMVYSSEGMGEMSRTFHKLYRSRLARGVWRDKERPVLINTWEATGMEFTEDTVIDYAKVAKKAGMELVVLDDGWFGKRYTDRTSLGDWDVNTEKLPNGIKGLADKIEDMGMKFGLWFEPEMISPESDLYREHPDWCIHVKGRNGSLERFQLVLDLTRQDVCDYVISVLTKALSESKISYIKWDMNRNMSEIGSVELSPARQSEVAHRYILNLYHILEEIKKQFPDVLLEGCASGGGRFDAGMMYYFNQYWTSDDSDAAERLYIQHGTSVVMPSIFMGAHVSAVPSHHTGREVSLKYRGDVAMCGRFGYELNITKMNDDELKQIAEQIKKYKEIESVVHFGDMYRLISPFESDSTALQYVSVDKKIVVLACYRIMRHPDTFAGMIKAQGLDKNADYRLRGTEKVFSGAVLMNYGIQFPIKDSFESEIMIFDKI